MHFWGNGVMEGSCAHGEYKAAVRLVRRRKARAMKCSPLLPTLLYILKQILQAIDDHSFHTLRLSKAQTRDLGGPTTLVPHIAHLPCPVPH